MFTDATNTNGYLLSFKHHPPPGFSYEYSRRELIEALKHKSHSLDSFISKKSLIGLFTSLFAKFHCDGPPWFFSLPDRSKKVSLWKLEHSRSSQYWKHGACVNIIYILSALVPMDSLNSVVKCLVLSLCSCFPWGHSLRSGSKNHEKQKETAVQKFFYPSSTMILCSYFYTFTTSLFRRAEWVEIVLHVCLQLCSELHFWLTIHEN